MNSSFLLPLSFSREGGRGAGGFSAADGKGGILLLFFPRREKKKRKTRKIFVDESTRCGEGEGGRSPLFLHPPDREKKGGKRQTLLRQGIKFTLPS